VIISAPGCIVLLEARANTRRAMQMTPVTMYVRMQLVRNFSGKLELSIQFAIIRNVPPRMWIAVK